jgi:FAD/FMN-containing dehydrogenase
MDACIAELIAALSADLVKTGADIPVRNSFDQTKMEPILPAALILPRTTEHVAKALKICNAHKRAVVTQGGMTGLAAGAHPRDGESALSLERMVGIEEVDTAAGTITALAGTTLQTIQEAAEQAGFFCAIDLGARGSCTIGGNVSTNAGGNQVLRFGMTRKNILGLEVVLADGEIVRSLNKMMKNNAGYDWTQYFIGAEGTLGVITRVVVMLQPKPSDIQTAVVAVTNTEAAIRLLRRAQGALPGGLLVFEAMWSEFYQIATGIMGLNAPVSPDHELAILMEAPGTREDFEAFLATAYEEGLLLDAAIAQSRGERDRMWALRESVYEHYKYLPKQVGFDISIPISRMEEAVQALRVELPDVMPGTIFVIFGHLADSNIHVNVMPPEMPAGMKARIEHIVYQITARLGGSVSAEHGIGQTKRPYLALSRTEAELALMRRIKAALDPNGVLNPGRVLV